MIGDVTEGSAAQQAGFQFEDRILAIETTDTPTWSDARIALLKHVLDGSREDQRSVLFKVETIDGQREERRLSVDGRTILKGEADIVGSLGFEQWWPRVPPVIGGLQDDGAALAAGLQIGDQIVSSNGAAVDTWRDWVLLVRASAGQSLAIEVLRDGELTPLTLVPGVRDVPGSEPIGFIGAWETSSFEQAQKARVTVSYPPFESLLKGLQRTLSLIHI